MSDSGQNWNEMDNADTINSYKKFKTEKKEKELRLRWLDRIFELRYRSTLRD